MPVVRSQSTMRLAVDSNIKEHLAWLRYLAHGRFTKRYGELFREHGDIVSVLTAEAQAVTRKYVYDVYTPSKSGPNGYTRSFNLLNSMRAISFSGKSLSDINVISDTTIAGRTTKWSPNGNASVKGTKGNPARHPNRNDTPKQKKKLLDKIWSYAAFFIKPAEFHSFIHAKPRRDFLRPLTKNVQAILKAHQVTVVAMAMRENMPENK